MKSSLYVILAGLLWGLISLFIRPLSAAGFSSLQIVMLRMVFSAAILLVFVLLKDRSLLKIHIKDIWMFIGTGVVSIVLFNYCYFKTIIESGASTAVVLLYTSPIFVTCISAVLFKERITLQKVIALIMTVTGCVFVAGIIGGSAALTPMALLTGIGSGLFYALYSIFGRFALEKYETLTVTVWTFLAASVGSVFIADLPGSISIIKAQPQALLYIIGISSIATVLPYFFYTFGLQKMEAGKAAIIVAVEPIVGTILGIFAYHESSEPLKVLGIILVISAILIMNISFVRRR